MHADSDEEAAASFLSGDHKVPFSAGTADPPQSWLAKKTSELSSLQRTLLEFDVGVPVIVNFRVDGKMFSVHRDVLQKDPQSVLFLLAERLFCCGDDRGRGSDVIEIPSRDATLFGMLLNLLRGYRSPVPEAYREACYKEACFYGLQHSWKSRYPVASSGPFHPLPCGNTLFADLVCAAASPFYSSGLHSIMFDVKRCETVAVGVVAEGARLGSANDAINCEGFALFWNDGRVIHNIGRFVLDKASSSYTAGTKIKVALDFEEHIVHWTLPGERTAAVVRLPEGTKFAFVAVVMKASELQVIHGE
ncbi:hypothetical protein DQ04_00661180 [Trypanosoma grayi]|uniref:hypothetical protein n=1 Tax=Trypanosoma grayi TaxID=71804 RepID=UPI0004F49386|nr:hypothetical protein DQ04_00661180 [Trypanosoma grayi]KEG14040.1 hypothetical protein DQ04_00661180 [Trypanosoma grayi]